MASGVAAIAVSAVGVIVAAGVGAEECPAGVAVAVRDGATVRRKAANLPSLEVLASC